MRCFPPCSSNFYATGIGLRGRRAGCSPARTGSARCRRGSSHAPATHHPHVHMIVPGGGISLDGERWIACRPGFFLPVRVLSRLFRRLVLEKLDAAHRTGELQFFGKHASLTNTQAFAAYLAPLRNAEWVVYSKRPFGGPEEVLRYLARYTHRVAISNRRLVSFDDNGVTFKWKDWSAADPCISSTIKTLNVRLTKTRGCE